MNKSDGDTSNARLVRKYHSQWRYLGRKFVQNIFLRRWLAKNFAVTVDGKDNLLQLADDKPFIVMANHQSHLDAPLIIGSLPDKIAAKIAVGAASDYFFKNYLQSKPMRILLNTFPIERGKTKAHRGLSADLVHGGVPILVFPEGTRSRTGELGHFHTGLARIALAESVPILPISLVGTRAAWPVGHRKPVSGYPRVTITFLPLIRPKSNETAEQLTERVKKVIQPHLDSSQSV